MGHSKGGEMPPVGVGESVRAEQIMEDPPAPPPYLCRVHKSVDRERD